MAPRKSVFRQPGAQHFQLVHRSQRDPLIHDPEASTHVLKSFERENEKKGKSRAELESTLDPTDLAHDLERANIGEAAAYGVYYDDTAYDYMQHLKTTGSFPDGEGTLLEAPSRTKDKGKAKEPLTLRDLPADVLPPTSELPRNYDREQAIPSSIAGFQPDMDPHLRQALEALEDDAFVEDTLDEDFFAELVADGEREEEEEVGFEFDEDALFAKAMVKAGGMPAEDEVDEDGAEDGEAWEARFAAFKREQKASAAADDAASDLDGLTEGGDTIGALPQLSVIGGKRRRKGTSDGSGYSMSSSSMFRNAGLSTLDDRFDKLEKDYAEDEEEDDEEEEEGAGSDDEAPVLITSREDFDAMMDDFLDNYEIVGRKMRPVLEGEDAAAKFATFRAAIAEGGIRLREGADEDDDQIPMPVDVDDIKDKWDCETILSTYSNLENHPRIIRARDSKVVPKIKLDPRTGLPSIEKEKKPKQRGARVAVADSSSATDEASDNDDDSRPSRVTVARQRGESKEDKKARKQAVKDEKKNRRVEKKATQERYASEFQQQRREVSQLDVRRVHKL